LIEIDAPWQTSFQSMGLRVDSFKEDNEG